MVSVEWRQNVYQTAPNITLTNIYLVATKHWNAFFFKYICRIRALYFIKILTSVPGAHTSVITMQRVTTQLAPIIVLATMDMKEMVLTAQVCPCF